MEPSSLAPGAQSDSRSPPACDGRRQRAPRCGGPRPAPARYPASEKVPWPERAPSMLTKMLRPRSSNVARPPATLPAPGRDVAGAMLRRRNTLRAGLACVRADAVCRGKTPGRGLDASTLPSTPTPHAERPLETAGSSRASMPSGRWWAPALRPGPPSVGGAMAEPALAGMASPAEAVRSCRATPAAAAVPGALLRHAGEPLAARDVRQAVVPGFADAGGATGQWLPPAHPAGVGDRRRLRHRCRRSRATGYRRAHGYVADVVASPEHL